MSSLSIVQIKVSDLLDFATSFFQSSIAEDVVPISIARAKSQVCNPSADFNDIGLLVAYNGARTIGYLGVLPRMLSNEGVLSKVHFTSTAYVPKEHRRTGAGIALARAGAKLPYELIACDNRPESERLCRGVDHFSEQSLMIAELKVESLARILSLDDFKWKLKRASIDEFKQFNFKQTVDENASAHFLRDKATVEWMLGQEWILNEAAVDTKERSYYFSEFHLSVEHIVISVSDRNESSPVGYQVFSLVTQKKKDSVLRTLKILDGFFLNVVEGKDVIRLATVIAKELGASSIETSMELASELPPFTMLAVLKNTKKRSYFLKPTSQGSPLAKAIPTLKLGYCDGDTAFS